MTYGIAAYVICRKSDAEVKKEIDRICDVKDTAGYFGFKDFTTQSQLERELSLRDYSVSNRGLRTGLTGTAEQIAERIIEFRQRRRRDISDADEPDDGRDGALCRRGDSSHPLGKRLVLSI